MDHKSIGDFTKFHLVGDGTICCLLPYFGEETGLAHRNREGKNHIKDRNLEGGLEAGGDNHHWRGGNTTIEFRMGKEQDWS